ncbi:MAG: hypothetical protein QOJ89_3585 [bacterium]
MSPVSAGRLQQAGVGRLLAGVFVAPVDEQLGRAAGVLPARTDTSDVIDAALVVLTSDRDEILTSDPDGLALLASTSRVHADIVRL